MVSLPPIGCIKINTDVFFLSSQTKLVARNDRGQFLYALVESSFISSLTLVAEGMTGRLGLLKALSLRAIDVMLESDSIKALVDNLNVCD